MESQGERKLHAGLGETGSAGRILLGVFYLMFTVYTVFMLKIILFKTIPLSAMLRGNFLPFRSLNVIPFRTIMEYFTSDAIEFDRVLANIGGNIAIFIPLGMFAAFMAGRKPLRLQVLWLLAISFSLEVIQYILALGSSDIDDILLNVTGGIIGIGLVVQLRKMTRSGNALLRAMAGAYLLMGICGFAAVAWGDPGLLPFTDSEVEYVDENAEILAGRDEAKADLFGKLAGVGTEGITVSPNSKVMLTAAPAEAEKEEEVEVGDVHVQVDASTRIFIRHIRSDGNQVINRYEEGKWAELKATLGKSGDTDPAIKVWLSGGNEARAEALLISFIE
ncbi:VanZ family protein [Paenibacillus macerans]|uniref:VanZ family protein n=1 Tax=Paenibacillus macerans TaxID=44252 RepID=UPI000EDF9575|nr:VanZ family protein [Paenibacillus macerans]GBK65275.1 VanZ family protein [Paenibacillus macerans]GBK71548.1 VanZ family protein [Paenibacillus macerans]